MGHWFGGPIEDLKRKKGVFEEHCAEVGRNPSDVLLTLGVGVIIVKDEQEGKTILERIPAERRPMMQIGTPERAAEILQKYVDAGFGGFTFNNPTLPTPEAIGRAGEVIKMLRGAKVS
jgi:alkanesulfonate monooxygenase SsuD/methylene tetrahydromethanopterin reductase-like flavin-dependent oxidoreductase (luciferase family)